MQVFGKCVLKLPIITLDWLPGAQFFLFAWDSFGFQIVIFDICATFGTARHKPPFLGDVQIAQAYGDGVNVFLTSAKQRNAPIGTVLVTLHDANTQQELGSVMTGTELLNLNAVSRGLGQVQVKSSWGGIPQFSDYVTGKGTRMHFIPYKSGSTPIDVYAVVRPNSFGPFLLR